ncbi:MAG: hypothetical protein JWP63_3741 [Candidatus Solibacter sp.]|jgi:hypothetical protein|nr:hypothetical protein [Candidatus Solibacter sp.]
MKLYRCPEFPMHWLAFSEKERWVKFPAESGGWQKRQIVPTRSIKPILKQQIPLWLGFNTGIPGAPRQSAPSADRPLRNAA